MSTKQPGYYRALLESIGSGPTIESGISICFKRSDGEVYDIYIPFEARQISSGYKGDSIDPPHEAEWDVTIKGIELDDGNNDPSAPLTDQEKEKITAWIDNNMDRFYEEAATKYSEEHKHGY